MASDIQAILPQNNNMNLANETLVYDVFSKGNNYHLNNFMNYGDKHEYSHYNVNGNYEYIESNRSSPDIIKMPFNILPTPRFKMVNYVKTKPKNSDQKKYTTKKSVNVRTNSPRSYDSDESYISYSSKDSADNNGGKHKENTANNNQNEYGIRPSLFHPHLYQPQISYNKNSKYHNNNNENRAASSMMMERKAHGLMKRFQARTHKLRFNPNPPDLRNGGPWDQLNQEMWDVFVQRIQKDDTYINKLNLWKSIFLFLRTTLTNYGLYLVGSTMSGFGLEGSDIDLCLLTKPFIEDPRIDSCHHLNRLKFLLLKHELASEAELIMAKVPILKFKNKETGFEIDLNCNNAVGIQNTHLLYCYAQMDWRVRPLVVIVKIWAQANNINDAKNMTISSYSWALMVIHYLQCGVTPPVLPCLHDKFPEKFNSFEHHVMDVHEEIEALKEFKSDNTRCLGDLLIGFFQYYSYFNYSQYAISVRTGSQLPIETCKQARSPKNDPHQWKCLCIEEPFDFTNTARSVFDLGIFKHIKQIIMSSYKELARNKTLTHILPVKLKR